MSMGSGSTRELAREGLVGVTIGDVVTVVVEVVELVAEGRKVRLHCEALVDGKLVLDGEAIVSVPGRPRAG